MPTKNFVKIEERENPQIPTYSGVGRYAPPLRKQSIYYKLLGILQHGRFVYHSLLLTNSINYFFIVLWTHVYLFYIWGYNALCCSNCSSFVHWELFLLAPVSIRYIPTAMLPSSQNPSTQLIIRNYRNPNWGTKLGQYF